MSEEDERSRESGVTECGLEEGGAQAEGRRGTTLNRAGGRTVREFGRVGTQGG